MASPSVSIRNSPDFDGFRAETIVQSFLSAAVFFKQAVPGVK
jgi:hypothetical protein